MTTSEFTSYVEGLLNGAQSAATSQLTAENDGVPPVATEGALERLAELSRDYVRWQASYGLWEPLGLKDWRGLDALKVTYELGDVSAGEPPIKINYDFSKTALPTLVVKSVSNTNTTKPGTS